MDNQEKPEEKPESQPKEKQSFFTTLPGIITALTGLVVAITGLFTVLGENGLLARLAEGGPTPTDFPTATNVDEDIILPTPVEATPEPTEAIPTAPICQNYSVYDGKANKNAVLVAYTETDFWVRYAEIEENIEDTSGVEIYIFDTSEGSGDCLRRWVKYLGAEREAHWPVSTTSNGRPLNEVWMNSPTPPLVGELQNWPMLPDKLLITLVTEDMLPDFAQVYMCGEDVPDDVIERVAYWHAATSEEALDGHLEQYQSNGYAVRQTVACGQ
jgi:hypothetical protein